MARPQTFKLPRMYVSDALDRGLDIGEVVGGSSRTLHLRCSAAQLDELVSDARYYQDCGGPGWEPELKPLGASARRTLAAIYKQRETRQHLVDRLDLRCNIRTGTGSYRGRVVKAGTKRVTVEWTYLNGRTTRRSVPVGEVYLHPVSRDALARELTAFRDFAGLVCAHPGYRPTIMPRDGLHELLASEYDRYQALRGDPRRAYPERI